MEGYAAGLAEQSNADCTRIYGSCTTDMHYLFPILEAFSCIVDSWNRKFLVHKDVNKNHNSFFRDLGMTPSKEDLSEDKFSRFSASLKLMNKMYHGLKTQIEKPLLSLAPRTYQEMVYCSGSISHVKQN